MEEGLEKEVDNEESAKERRRQLDLQGKGHGKEELEEESRIEEGLKREVENEESTEGSRSARLHARGHVDDVYWHSGIT